MQIYASWVQKLKLQLIQKSNLYIKFSFTLIQGHLVVWQPNFGRKKMSWITLHTFYFVANTRRMYSMKSTFSATVYFGFIYKSSKQHFFPEPCISLCFCLSSCWKKHLLYSVFLGLVLRFLLFFGLTDVVYNCMGTRSLSSSTRAGPSVWFNRCNNCRQQERWCAPGTAWESPTG